VFKGGSRLVITYAFTSYKGGKWGQEGVGREGRGVGKRKVDAHDQYMIHAYMETTVTPTNLYHALII
jgi:hypothetical protein